MIRKMAIAGCICLFAEAAAAQEVKIEVSGKADSEGSSATESAKIPQVPLLTSSESPESPRKEIPEGYEAKIDYGHGLYLKGDYQGALSVYKAAEDSKSTDPLPLYFIACAEVKLGQYDEALSALAALKTICGERLPSLNARGLFLVAVIEEMRGNSDNAIAAWTAYKQFASAHKNIPTFVGTADARIQAYTKKLELEEQYKAVRERIGGGA